MLVGPGIASCSTAPGMCVIAGSEPEKPSLWLHTSGSGCAPPDAVGITPAGSATWRPVGVSAATVKTLLGKGNAQ